MRTPAASPLSSPLTHKAAGLAKAVYVTVNKNDAGAVAGGGVGKRKERETSIKGRGP